MGLLVRRMRRRYPSPLIRSFWLVSGIVFFIVGAIAFFMPMIPWIYGILILTLAGWCLTKASVVFLTLLMRMPFLGPALEEFMFEGVSDRKRRFLIRVTAFFLASTIYANPQATTTILGYLLAVPLIEIVAHYQNQRLRRT